MNINERKMVSILRELKEKYACTGVKMEFEAEGTRLEEGMRLKEISMRAGLDLTTKIGGCEAIKDMYDARSIGTTNLVAPMVETPYALQKYLQAVNQVFKNDYSETRFLVNIETVVALNNFKAMRSVPNFRTLNGIVLGRVDMAGSAGLHKTEVNSDVMFNLCEPVAKWANYDGLMVVVGGGVSYDSHEFFNRFERNVLSKFETRKVVFSCPDALGNPREAYLKAVEFELMWLKNKQQYYGIIHTEDQDRIEMLEKRYG